MTTFTFHADPSHGWLQVPVSELASLGLHPRDFSQYSFASAKGFNVYLEEDCDAAKFFRIYEAKHGTTPAIVEKHSNSPSFIRNLPRIQSWHALA